MTEGEMRTGILREGVGIGIGIERGGGGVGAGAIRLVGFVAAEIGIEIETEIEKGIVTARRIAVRRTGDHQVVRAREEWIIHN